MCLEESIYIHNIKDMKLLKTLLNTPSNPSGKTLIPRDGNCKYAVHKHTLSVVL